MTRYWVEQRGLRDALGYSFTNLRSAMKAYDGLGGRVVLVRISDKGKHSIVKEKGHPDPREFSHIPELRGKEYVARVCKECGCTDEKHGLSGGKVYCSEHGIHKAMRRRG